MNKLNLPLLIVVSLFCCQSFLINAQTINLTAGVGQKYLYDFSDDSQRSDYSSGELVYFKFSADEISSHSVFNNISFEFRKSNATAQYLAFFTFCGLGAPPLGSGTNPITSEKISKYEISVATYLLNVKLYKGMKFRLGAEVNKTINTSFSHAVSEHFPTRSDALPFVSQLENNTYSVAMLSEIRLGSMKIRDGMNLSPVYNVAIGITPELENAFNTRAIRHSLGLSLQFGVKPKN